MKIELNRSPRKEEKANDFLYISQDNYEVIDLVSSDLPYKYLYCDSAVSCTIAIVSGKNKKGNQSVAIASLSGSEKFSAFGKVIEDNFIGNLTVFGYVGNPPQHQVNKSRKADLIAAKNLNTMSKWVSQYSITNVTNENKPNIIVEKATLLLGETTTMAYSDDLDCYGVDISANPPVVNNRRFYLSLKDRDPSGGLQSLFCSFGTKLENPLLLVRASSVFDPFDKSSLISNQKSLVNAAIEDHYEKYEGITDDEILEECSSTPYLESPWFCDMIREASRFVRMNFENTCNLGLNF